MTTKQRIPTTGTDSLFRRFTPEAQECALYELQTLAMGMSADELQRFCEGTMNALIVMEDQFRKRFPREYAAWCAIFNEKSPE